MDFPIVIIQTKLTYPGPVDIKILQFLENKIKSCFEFVLFIEETSNITLYRNFFNVMIVPRCMITYIPKAITGNNTNSISVKVIIFLKSAGI